MIKCKMMITNKENSYCFSWIKHNAKPRRFNILSLSLASLSWGNNDLHFPNLHDGAPHPGLARPGHLEVGGDLVEDGEAVDAAAGRVQLEHLHQVGGKHQQRGPEVALHHELPGHASAGRHFCSAKNLTLTLLVSARAVTARMSMKSEKIFVFPIHMEWGCHFQFFVKCKTATLTQPLFMILLSGSVLIGIGYDEF